MTGTTILVRYNEWLLEFARDMIALLVYVIMLNVLTFNKESILKSINRSQFT